MTTLEMHTGSTKARTYRMVTGEVVRYGSRQLPSGHAVRTVTIRTAQGEEFTEALGRTKEVEEMQETPKTETPARPEVKVTECPDCDGKEIRRNNIYVAHIYPMKRAGSPGYRRSGTCHGRRPRAAWDVFRPTQAEALESAVRSALA